MEYRKPSLAAKSMQTCDVCKLRHQKCSGDRPSCSHCQLRNLECVYSTVPAHKVDRSVVKRRDSAKDVSGPHPPPTRPRHGSPPVSVRDAVVHASFDSSATGSSTGDDANMGKKTTPPRAGPPRSAATASLQYLVGAIRLILLGEEESEHLTKLRTSAQHEHVKATHVWKTGGERPANLVKRANLPPKAFAQSLLDSFLDGPNKFIYTCDPAESQQQLDQLYDTSTPVTETTLALIYLQLSVGAQFTDGVSEQVCSAWYETGHAKIETALEENDQDCWLWVLQALLLTCLHCIVAKPSKCYITLGSAIRVAQTYRIDGPYEASHCSSPAEYAKWRQIWLSTVFLDAWFSAALGRVPQVTSTVTNDPFLRNPNCDFASDSHIVQTNLSRIGVIVSRILRDIHGTQGVDLATYDQYITVLDVWISALPPALRFHTHHEDVVGNTQVSVGDRSAMFHLEITYLGTVMLLTRPLLLHCAAVEKQQPQCVLPIKVRSHAQTCVNTAIQLGHSCASMMSRGLLVRRAWLTIYYSFNAALIIMLNQSRHSISAGLISGPQGTAQRVNEETGLHLCLSVLSYCAEQDSLAEHYLNIARAFRSVLVNPGPPLAPMNPGATPQPQAQSACSTSASTPIFCTGVPGGEHAQFSGHPPPLEDLEGPPAQQVLNLGQHPIDVGFTMASTEPSGEVYIKEDPHSAPTIPSTPFPLGSVHGSNSANTTSNNTPHHMSDVTMSDLKNVDLTGHPEPGLSHMDLAPQASGLEDIAEYYPNGGDPSQLPSDMPSPTGGGFFRDQDAMGDVPLNGALSDLQEQLNIQNWFINPESVFS